LHKRPVQFRAAALIAQHRRARARASSASAASECFPFWLALRNITAKWNRSAYDWKTAMN